MRIGLDHCVKDAEDAVARPWGTVGKGIGVRRGLRSKVRHELSTRFVIPAGKPGVRAPQQRGDKHAASAEAVGERERPTSPACNIAGMWPDPADNEKNIRWVRDYYAALAPHSLAGGYVNFASADDQGARPRQLWPLLRPAHRS